MFRDILTRTIKSGTLIVLLLLLCFLIIDLAVIDVATSRVAKIVFSLVFVVVFLVRDHFEWAGRKLVQKFEKSSRELEYINQVTEALRSTMKVEDLLTIILNNLTRELKFDRAMIYVIEQMDKKNVLKSISSHGVNLQAAAECMIRPLDKEKSIIARCVLEKQSYLITDAPNNYFCEQNLVNELMLKEFAVIPIVVKEKGYGALLVDNLKSGRPITETQIEGLLVFANQVGIAIENAKLYEKIEELSIKDELTGLYNRRYFQSVLAKELDRAKRFSHQLTLLMFDIDNFKHYNDANGHLAGDDLLRELGKLVLQHTRDLDIPARYGGEEFTIVLLETSRQGGLTIAERFRQAVEAMPAKHREKQPLGKLSISGGVATFPDDAENVTDLINFADKGLYEAKEAGRNRVCVFDK